MPNLASIVLIADQRTLTSFVDEMLNDEQVSVSEKNTKKTELMRDLNARVTEHIVKLLNSADTKELNELIDDEAPEDFIHDFLEGKIPNLESEIAQILVTYKNNYTKKPALN